MRKHDPHMRACVECMAKRPAKAAKVGKKAISEDQAEPAEQAEGSDADQSDSSVEDEQFLGSSVALRSGRRLSKPSSAEDETGEDEEEYTGEDEDIAEEAEEEKKEQPSTSADSSEEDAVPLFSTMGNSDFWVGAVESESWEHQAGGRVEWMRHYNVRWSKRSSGRERSTADATAADKETKFGWPAAIKAWRLKWEGRSPMAKPDLAIVQRSKRRKVRGEG